jgi:hypothetical protein
MGKTLFATRTSIFRQQIEFSARTADTLAGDAVIEFSRNDGQTRYPNPGIHESLSG